MIFKKKKKNTEKERKNLFYFLEILFNITFNRSSKSIFFYKIKFV